VNYVETLADDVWHEFESILIAQLEVFYLADATV
jgi:hypothetical protein